MSDISSYRQSAEYSRQSAEYSTFREILQREFFPAMSGAVLFGRTTGVASVVRPEYRRS